MRGLHYHYRSDNPLKLCHTFALSTGRRTKAMCQRLRTSWSSARAAQSSLLTWPPTPHLPLGPGAFTVSTAECRKSILTTMSRLFIINIFCHASEWDHTLRHHGPDGLHMQVGVDGCGWVWMGVWFSGTGHGPDGLHMQVTWWCAAVLSFTVNFPVGMYQLNIRSIGPLT